jgi:hypothetical protein
METVSQRKISLLARTGPIGPIWRSPLICIIIDNNDIFGDGVNIAARLEGIAEPGTLTGKFVARSMLSSMTLGRRF